MNETFPIFLNPNAGRGAAAEQQALLDGFREAGAEPRIRLLNGGNLHDLIRAEVDRGTEVIGAAGGDGTISAAANAIARSPTALLPIPLGTLNHFSNRYGIGTLAAATEAWQQRQISSVHVGTVNERVFVNNASCGFYPHLVRHRDNLERVLPRVPAMWLAGMRVLFELPMMRLKIEIAGRNRELRTPALWVGIGRNSLRLPVPGDAEVDGNVLEIVGGRAETRRHAIALAFRLMLHLRQGLEPRAPNLMVEHARHFTLHARHPVDIALDGEAFRMRGPLEFALLENALRIICLVGPPG